MFQKKKIKSLKAALEISQEKRVELRERIFQLQSELSSQGKMIEFLKGELKRVSESEEKLKDYLLGDRATVVNSGPKRAKETVENIWEEDEDKVNELRAKFKNEPEGIA